MGTTVYLPFPIDDRIRILNMVFQGLSHRYKENYYNSHYKEMEASNRNREDKRSLPEDSRKKGKFRPKLGMLIDQQGSTLSDQKKIKGRWKQYTKNLHKKDKRMADIFEEDASKEGPVILES